MTDLCEKTENITESRASQTLIHKDQVYGITTKRIDFSAQQHDLFCNSGFTLYAVITGSAECRIWDDNLNARASLSRGALFITPGRGTFHMDLDRPCKMVAVRFQRLTNNGFRPDWDRIGIQVFRDVLVFETILRIHEEQMVQENVPSNLMETAASLLMITLDIIDQRAEKQIHYNRTNSHIGIQKAIRWIEDNLDEGLTLNQLAKVAGLSAWHFLRVFKAKYHLSPHNYIKNRRLAKAKRMLSETNIPISHIAYDCGFSSQSHLTTTFKQHFGCTPGRYRQNVQREPQTYDLQIKQG